MTGRSEPCREHEARAVFRLIVRSMHVYIMREVTFRGLDWDATALGQKMDGLFGHRQPIIDIIS